MEWQPISTAPKDRTIIVYLDWCNQVAVGRNYSVNRVHNSKPGWHIYWTPLNSALIGGEPTHWMPLPEPPKCA